MGSKALPLAIVLLLAAASCAPMPAPKPAPPTPRPPLLPCYVKADITLELNLPEALAAEAKLPPLVKGTLTVDIRADAASASPPRSHYRGTVHIKLTDPAGTRTYIDAGSTVEGDANMTPDEALPTVFQRLGAAAELLARPFQPPMTRPSSQ